MGILTTDIPDIWSCEFEIFILKIAQVVDEYPSVVFLYVLSI